MDARTCHEARSDEAGLAVPAGSLIPSIVSEAMQRDTLPLHLRKPRLRRWEATEYLDHVYGLRIAASTLAKMVTTGGGPAFNRGGRVPLYPREELDRWATQRLGRLVRSSSDAAG